MAANSHSYIDALLQEMVTLNGSDLYLTVGSPAMLRVDSGMKALTEKELSENDIQTIIRGMLDKDKLEEFHKNLELNIALHWKDKARFRLNFFQQQHHPGMVIRRIRTEIPTLDAVTLPVIYGDLIMEKRGLILVVGPTGSGKSTSIAAMLGYRNEHGEGHIITIEDPVEFIHKPNRCLFTHREVGVDTHSYATALKNALRQRPDVVLIGEIRDAETMQFAMNFAETGHLVVATLHANNANQTLERILSFFPEEQHRQILHALSMNLKAVLSQRLVITKSGGRTAAVEIMVNKGLIKKLIEEGKTKEIKEMIAKNQTDGMLTFDQSLLELFQRGLITQDTALAEADNPTDLKLKIKQAETEGGAAAAASGAKHISVSSMPQFRL